MMKTLNISLMMGVGLAASLLAAPLLPTDRPVDAEDVPEFLMELKDPTTAEESMILEVLGLYQGEDGQLKLVRTWDMLGKETPQVDPAIDAHLQRIMAELHKLDLGKVSPASKEGEVRGEQRVKEGEKRQARWMIGVVIRSDDEGALVL